jgi:hypothetical protein
MLGGRFPRRSASGWGRRWRQEHHARSGFPPQLRRGLSRGRTAEPTRRRPTLPTERPRLGVHRSVLGAVSRPSGRGRPRCPPSSSSGLHERCRSRSRSRGDKRRTAARAVGDLPSRSSGGWWAANSFIDWVSPTRLRPSAEPRCSALSLCGPNQRRVPLPLFATDPVPGRKEAEQRYSLLTPQTPAPG